MNALGRVCATLMVVLVLGGCAQAPKKQAFNREAATHVKRVVLAHAENQPDYEAAVLGHPGMSFGLIGGLVAAADIQAKSKRLTAAIDPVETRLQQRFAERLRQGLSQAGYEVELVALPRDTKEDDMPTQAQGKARGDAVLTVMLTGAYWAAGPTTDYYPRLLAKVRKLDGRNGSLLYQDSISYGYNMPQMQTVHLASDTKFRFATMDALVADPALTRDGLYRGLDAIADQIVADLKRP